MKNWQKIRQQPELIEQFLVREKTIDGIRSFFKTQGFHEVDTPLLVKHPGTEPFLEVFQTTLNMADGKQKTGFLITSPEYSLKKLLSAGLGNIFQICKAFRNGEGVSGRHNPEFTIIEWYRAEADYFDIMKDCEDLITALSSVIRPNTQQQHFEYQGKIYDLTTPWPRYTVVEAFLKFAQVDTETMLDEAKLKEVGKAKGYQVTEETTWEEVYNQIFLNEIEPQLAQSMRPAFIYDYPVSQAALSRKKKSDPRFAERFELFLAGLELGNAFSELNDPIEQEIRIESDLSERKRLGKVAYGKDEDFIQALREGMPSAAGIAVGIDRLVMLMANVATIDDTLFFPVSDVFNLE